MQQWKLPVRDRMMLHLFDFIRFRDSFESPLELTQAGITKAVGIRASHATQYLKPLLSDGMVEEETRHIVGKPRRRKVYFLTPKGRQWAASMRATLLEETVPFKRRDGSRERVPLRTVYHDLRRRASLLSLVQELASLGHVSDPVEATESGILDLAQEAPRVRHFHGREAEMEAILDRLPKTPLVVIRGMAGLGKTTLGSKICERLRGERSLFWRRIRSWDTAFDLASRVGVFLEALGRPSLHRYLSGSTQRSLSRVEELMAADLAGLQTLMVFDDVHAASEEAETLLAVLCSVLREVGGSSVLLLSRTTPGFYSRRAMELEGDVSETSLGPLDRASGEALLADAGVPLDQRGRLFELSGGNPLFMRLIAERGAPAGVWDGWETLHAYIGEEVAPLLNQEEHHCLEVASLFELPIPPEGLLLEEGGELGTVLSLQRKGLLDDIGAGKVALHDSLREYFRRGLPPKREETLVDQVVPWLLQEAEKAVAGSRVGTRRSWLLAKHPKGAETALALIGNALLLDNVASRRVRSLERLGDLRRVLGDLSGAVKAFQQALASTSEKEMQGRLHRKIAESQIWLLRPEEAQEAVAAGLKLLGPEPSIETAWLLSARAMIKEHHLQDYAGARRDLETALGWLPSLAEDLELRAELEVYLGGLRLIEPERDLHAVQEHFEAALSCFEALQDPDGIPFTLRLLGFTLLERGDFEGARSCIERAAVLAEEAGEYVTLIFNAWFLAECLGDYDRAEEMYGRALEPLRKGGLPEDIWRYRLLSDLHRRMGRYEEARETLAYFLDASEGIVNVYRRVENLALMARVCLLCNDVEEANRYIQEARQLSGGIGSRWLDFHVAWAAGLSHAVKNEVSQAEAWFQQGLKPAAPEGRRVHPLEYVCTLFERGELLLDYGQALVSWGEREKARDILGTAREALERGGRRSLERKAVEALDSIEEGC